MSERSSLVVVIGPNLAEPVRGLHENISAAPGPVSTTPPPWRRCALEGAPLVVRPTAPAYPAHVSDSVSRPTRRHWIRIITGILAAAAFLVVVAGLVSGAQLGELAATTGPVLAFVLGMTIVAELASMAGVFTVLASHLAAWGRGRVILLWSLVLVMIVLITAFMSLDTTAVLVTPIVVALARRVGLSPLPFALATVWLANTASLFLPVSNLTNLIAADTFGPHPSDFVSALWAPALTAVAITVAALSIIYRRSLTGRYTVATPVEVADRPLLIVGMIVVGLLVPLLVSGADVAIVAGGGCGSRPAGGIRDPQVQRAVSGVDPVAHPDLRRESLRPRRGGPLSGSRSAPGLGERNR